MADLAKSIRMAVDTGKVEFGSNKGKRNSLTAGAKAVIISSNCPSEVKVDLLHYCKLSGVPTLEFPGTSLELGSLCGVPFPVCALSVKDPGNSDVLQLAKPA